MTLAKGVGGGLPVGVMCAKPHVAELYDSRRYGKAKHATTLGGNCISMAAAAAVFRVLERDRLVERAESLGQHAMNRLRQFQLRCPAIQVVRGKGLFIGIVLDQAPPTGKPTISGEVVKQCLQRGVIIQGAQNNVIRLAPPLTITPSQLDQGLEVIEQVLSGN
jgi:4-aminobutyrate aminotransferase-like enzyme